MLRLLPHDPVRARLFNAAAMELGAVICTARAPKCDACPIAAWCEWRGSGYPDNAPSIRRQAAFEGSDRQVRGRIMAVLRAAHDAIDRVSVLEAAATGGVRDASQPQRAFDSLVADGLIVEVDGYVRLP